MHELALCDAIVDTVSRMAEGRRVTRVDVRIGHFRQVVPESLQQCWEMVTKDGPHEGCKLVIDHVPAVVRCRDCDAETTLDLPILLCGKCDSADVEVVTGEEFLIGSFDRAREVV